MKIKKLGLWLLGAWFALPLLSGCGSDGGLNVSGVVLSIDSLAPAQGVKVWVLDNTDIVSETATNANGEFSLSVPKGSSFTLVTDDFDNTQADVWIPFINPNPAIATVDTELSEVLIHACPKPETADVDNLKIGTVAAVNQAVEVGGYWPTVTSALDASGIVIVFFWTTPEFASIKDADPTTAGDQPLTFVEGIEMTVAEEAEFGKFFYTDLFRVAKRALQSGATPPDPLAFPDGDGFCDGTSDSPAPICLGPTMTGAVGSAFVVGDPAYTKNTISVSYKDNNPLAGATGGRTTPWTLFDDEYPVRKGQVTEVLIGCTDGECNKDIKDIFIALGILS